MLRYSTGLRDNINGMKAVVKGAIIGATLAFVDGGASADTITDSGNGFITALFAPGDKLFVQGATTAANDSALTGVSITSVAAGTLTIPTASVNTAEAGAAGTVVAVAKGGSLKDLLKDGVIRVFSGAVPASPDDAITGTLLCEFSASGVAFVAGAFDNGLEFEDDPTAGVIEKASGETWQGTAVADGAPTHFRHVGNAADTNAASTTLPRIQGTVGSGGDMLSSGASLVTGRTYTIDSYAMTLAEYYGA